MDENTPLSEAYCKKKEAGLKLFNRTYSVLALLALGIAVTLSILRSDYDPSSLIIVALVLALFGFTSAARLSTLRENRRLLEELQKQ